MPKLISSTPKYRRHKASGQAIVTLNGRDHYLGTYGSRTSGQAWVKANGCDKESVNTTIPDTVKDGTTITRKAYGSGKVGAEAVVVLIEVGGHTWPGQEPRVRFLGKSTKNVSAKDMMWDLLVKHPMK